MCVCVFHVQDVKSFQNYFKKFNSHPFDIYYDLETTRGNESNKNIKVMPYVYSLLFNLSLPFLSDFCVYRAIVQNYEELKMKYTIIF